MWWLFLPSSKRMEEIMVKITKEIPQELLDSVAYVFSTGELMWKTTGKGRRKDRRILSKHYKTGHLNLAFNHKKYLVHRVIWTLHYGPIPEGFEIDHRNTITSDNRLQNLRISTSSENNCNSKTKTKSKHGYKGIGKNGRGYWASIMKNGKKHYLGTFPSPEEAHLAYAQAAALLHGEFARAA